MAKEQWHNWGRTVITIVTLVFVCGVTYQRITTTADGVAVNVVDIKDANKEIHAVKDDIHRVELDAKDIKAVAVQAAESGKESVRMFQEIQKAITPIQISIGKMEVKMETLTKD